MEVKSKVFKRKTGKSKNKWVVRIEYFDELKGKKRFMEHFICWVVSQLADTVSAHSNLPGIFASPARWKAMVR
jgi:uncharacterized protein YifN (PemK superfamily)